MKYRRSFAGAQDDTTSETFNRTKKTLLKPFPLAYIPIPMMTAIYIFGGFFVGLAIGLIVYFMRAKGWEAERSIMDTRLNDAENANARQREDFEKSLTNLQMTFKGLSSEVLKESREEFLKQAEPRISEHIRPLKEALSRYDEALRSIENKREEAYGGLKGLLNLLQEGQTKLTHETGSLVAALKSPTARGRWGEVTLKRVVEVSGMSSYCDFEEQVTATGEDGRLRPDLVVRLPGTKTVVVDAKAPLDAYMNAVESKDESIRVAHLASHAQSVRDHMRKLGQKSYWSQFDSAPDFVVLFLPGESFFSAALEQDRALIEDGMKNKVVLATPTTLIALLRVVAMGWQQEQLAENSERISEAGKDLFERCKTFSEHFTSIGSSLDKAISFFNKAVGSWERRIIPGAKRLKELGASRDPDAEIPVIEPVERKTRQLNAADVDETSQKITETP